MNKKTTIKERKPHFMGLLRLALSVALAVAWGGVIQAAWLDNVPITVVQPNGDTLHIFATGDEFYHYMHDADGYTIVQNPETRYYVYADKVDDKLVATRLVVGMSNPAEAIQRPRLTISNEEYQQRRIAREGRDPYGLNGNTKTLRGQSGDINHVVIMITFTDAPTITKTFQEIDPMFNATGPNDRSVYNYFKTTSYDRVHITTSYFPEPNGNQFVSYECPHESNYFRPFDLLTNWQGYHDEEQRWERYSELLVGALTFVRDENLIPESLNIDFNNDGKIDVITFAVNADVDGRDGMFWPHKSNFNDPNWDFTINGKRPDMFTFELIQSGYFYVNVFCHELCHVFGAPDLYHNPGNSYSDNPDPVGRWDVMCYNHDDNNLGIKQNNASAYIKWKYLNWIDDIPIISEAGTYTLHTLGSHETQNAFRIPTDDPHQFYIVEYRSNTELFDENIDGTGLMIYRVNDNYSGNYGAYPKNGIYDELYAFRPGGNSITQQGDLTQAHYGSETGRTSFRHGSDPSPFLSDGTPDNHISITDISENREEGTVSFRFGYHDIEISAFPEQAGVVEGGGQYVLNSSCTVTATPNLGFAFTGWYNNALGSILYSRQQEYTFTVAQDRTLVAHFAPRSYTITAVASSSAGGSVSGGGTYPAESVVTVSAHANPGYRFNGWMENGEIVATANYYTFYARANRNLTATFVSTDYAIGSLVTNPDGSRGVVFHLNQDGTEGLMVALEDASEGCAWGPATDIVDLRNVPFNDITALNDLSGYRNTGIIRTAQGIGNGYAASMVDYANGWYLPSAGELRKLYAALPFVESAITAAGGALLTEGNYWSSTEYSATDALIPSFAMSNTGKTSSCRVRAIRRFVAAGSNVVLVSSNDNSLGTATISGNGTFAPGQTVTVTAMPENGCAFEYWSENGVAVSFDAVYQFGFTQTRSLTAHFSVKGSVGSIVCNADGSKGVVFWLSPDGDEGLMVALEDASEGCVWGPTEKVYSLVNCPFNDLMALKDNSGARNTRAVRNYQGIENEYAATLVDFANGWYLPSAGELRKLYAALPMIEAPLAVAGGSTLTEDNYWSSTEYSATDALVPSFGMNNINKGGTSRVRAIRSFATAGPNCVTAKPNNASFGTTSVSGSGEFSSGQSVTVTAYPVAGYVFDSWTEAGMTVSYNPTYQFTFTRSRALTANFVSPGSVGSTIVNADGSMGVVFYTDPSGVGGWQVALTDDSDGCAWGNTGEDVLAMENLNPDPVFDLLSDLDGRRNSRVMRGWFVGHDEYAANQVDYNRQWFLPTAGQMRKLYAALPMIETAIINAGGSLLTDDAYWSSTERSANEAWTPSFALGSSNKGENRRVRAVRHFYTADVQNAHIFVGTNGTLWSDPSNWINPSRNLLSSQDDVIVTTQCVVDEDATVKSLTMAYGSSISVNDGKTLAATESISNTYDSRINLGLGAQLVNPTEGTHFSMNKEIIGYGNSEDGGWYTIATPLKDGMALSQLTTGSYDLYVYHEPMHYWLNQKNSDNGITMLENGIGYLYASQNTRTLTFDGQAKASNAEISTAVTNSASAGRLRGFNLIGNPFTNNVAINSLKLNGTTLSAYYKVSNGNALMAYTDADDEPIRPAEGFFVQGEAGTVSFNASSRGNVANGYVRLVLTHNGKMLDRAYLKTNDGVGLAKMRFDNAHAELYFRNGEADFAVAPNKEDEVEYPLCFKTKRNGFFTIDATLLNAQCDYLHLIDNLTGADVDLLAMPTYAFEAKTSDYPSRFKLVLLDKTVDGPHQETFVHFHNGKCMIATEREATMQIIDVFGRVLHSEQVQGTCEKHMNVAPGVYVIRLLNDDVVKSQKVIIK